MNDIRAELVKAKAYRQSYWMWPLMFIAAGLVSAFSVSAITQALEQGESLADQVPAVAFLTGAPTFFVGLILAAWATTLVTADSSSGMAHHSHMAMTDVRIFSSKGFLIAAAAVLATILTAVTGLAVAIVLVPTQLITMAVTSSLFWINVLGTFSVHLFWGLLALVAALFVPRPALSMGIVLAIVLAVPAIEAAATSAGLNTAIFKSLPSALMTSALVTGTDAVTAISPLLSIVLLIAWCAVLVGLSPVALRRSRVYC